MAFDGLESFIAGLEKLGGLVRIGQFADPELEITEITDRVTRSDGRALLFENTGTDFPVLINAYGSDDRMAFAIGMKHLDDAGNEIKRLMEDLSEPRGTLLRKLSSLPSVMRLAGLMPSRSRRRGSCQQVIHRDPDLGILPVLKCWPHDGGRYITLPIVHTIHPVTGKHNAGMYRMQVIDRKTTAMHWQRHKTGAAHFEAWKSTGKMMPVSVALGGDPVYAYSATAPLPDGIDEYILAGFLRKRKVRLVRCLTNELFVPEDADIIIEGYVDPGEDLVLEGPFGDHTGFYSLADWYPLFHVTCITHRRNAVYPATIVGIPPQEDAWIARATERLFLAPVKMALQPEIEDFHMPAEGVAHNLVIVKIRKSYPGQGMKVLASLSGAGQMMFSKYLVAISGDIDIRNYTTLAFHVFQNTDMSRDLVFSHGPLDVLDHASDASSFGGKLGVDATIKHPEELAGMLRDKTGTAVKNAAVMAPAASDPQFVRIDTSLAKTGIPVAIVAIDTAVHPEPGKRVADYFSKEEYAGLFRLVLAVDFTVDTSDLHMVAWQLLANSDPERDHVYISPDCLLIDGTIKAFRKGGFPRKWPNAVCSDPDTIALVDKKWRTLGIGPLISSPSGVYRKLLRKGRDEIITGS